MVDLKNGDRWIDLDSTRAWNWQQGCMLQWLPQKDDAVVRNDREGNQFVSRILHVNTGKTRTLPHPVYTLSPDGKTAISPDFNTDGSRFFFLHRWRNPAQPITKFQTRAFTCNREGQEWYCLDPYGGTSHFIWRDPEHILAWAWHPSYNEKFYLYKDLTPQVEVVAPAEMPQNGHISYVPGTDNQWVLNDTYPDRERYQHPYLFHLAKRRKVPLGDFYSPPAYGGEWRCDTHPRMSRDGTMVCIDSSRCLREG
jgi:hypothetical protein